jgi:hypothetical protein
MPKFLFVYRSPVPAPNSAPPGPDDIQKILAAWGAWIDKFAKKGLVTDPGDGLQETGRVVRTTGVTDGPFVEAKEILGGYSIISADSYDAAVAVAKECPAVFHGTVEVRELAGFS